MTGARSTVDCATAPPMALTLTVDSPIAIAIPVNSRVMLLRMTASIHESDSSKLWEARPCGCDGHHIDRPAPLIADHGNGGCCRAVDRQCQRQVVGQFDYFVC